jgi:hypothetical protein
MSEADFARGYQAASTEMQADLDDLTRAWDIDMGALRAELARVRAEFAELRAAHERSIAMIEQVTGLLAAGRYVEALTLVVEWRQTMDAYADANVADPA